jgi:antirestriction protein ArdC/phage/plasmid primase-like uncharacterized protein
MTQAQTQEEQAQGEQKEQPKRKPFYEEFAEKVIQHLEAGTAPWQRPWHPGKVDLAPHNPISGTVYQGTNRVNLALTGWALGYDDPRWMTYKQAQEQGYQVKAGSRSEAIVYYQFTKKEPVLDENDKPVLDENGKQKTEVVELDRPILRVAHVFNAAQIDGLPPLQLTDKAFAWDPIEKAESILSASGAEIKHDQSNRAFYRPMTYSIHMPPRENFEEPGKYYGTALHELGHWTGHGSRMNREFGAFGSEGYAREELRAEIASWMLGQDTGIAHDPGQHAAYVQNWVKALREDPFEIQRACRDAEHIKDYVLGLEMKKELEVGKEKPEIDREPSIAAEKTVLAVPYKDKDQAKEFGARWDNAKKTWFAPEGTDLAKLQAWIPKEPGLAVAAPALTPAAEFARAITEMGGDLGHKEPILNGKIQRIPLVGRSDGKDFAYCGYEDAHPAGWMNNYSTGEKRNWKFSGQQLSEEQKSALKAEAAQQRESREQERKLEQDKVAVQARERFDSLPLAGSGHPYLVAKGVTPLGIKESENGKQLLVPLLNDKGEMRSLQYIEENGFKSFMAGAEKKGNFFIVGCEFSELPKQSEVLIAEGYATAASLYEATGTAAVVAFDAGNLAPVAENVRAMLPDAHITLCADNDHAHTLHSGEPFNIGVERAKTAAELIHGDVLIPKLTEKEKSKGFKDFNDIHQSRGLEAVAKQLEKPLEKTRTRQAEAGLGLAL